jgi:hypothetical protein
MTELERRKLRMLREQYPGFLTADEALRLALEAEQIKRDCGPGDPAWQRFAYEQQAMETMALLLEKEAAAKAARA